MRVVPKLAGDNIGLVEMIEFATGLDSLRRSSSARSLHAEGTGLFDLIALLLAEGTELILRGGLLADYVGETNCFAFLIDMNRLFEMFVFRLC